ncbi:hypothetical protein SERLADRAFT_438516 [Serpula lacrymans var. lacrymans S7.9]|uniref:Uncharacterized protein n=1 Tax=Serpula lacrymans var. lacrymans (strain S7.9) TaxID=578457 RepID=F8NVX8_SERL9|nr:uncharacterized protein SERLADRAFT_438516 [Serpula lacrymans var. lacrymans S7.9]EGO24912.1 hypothetical protein SERLADRAFT_438516 [Serpula lacrymans var. lacrymans S7.9]
MPWPSERVLDLLTQKASGSFIFASTFIKFVSEAGGMAHQRLLTALKSHQGLDPLYTQVFSHATHPDNARGDVVDLMHVVGAILTIAHPLPLSNLAFLFQVELPDFMRILLRIQSVLLIPDDDREPVYLLHTSLRDYMTTQSRSGVFFIDLTAHHVLIALKFLRLFLRDLQHLYEYKPQGYTRMQRRQIVQPVSPGFLVMHYVLG